MIPPVCDYRGGTKILVQVVIGVSPFKLVVPHLARRDGTIFGVEYLVLKQFATGGNCVLSRFVGS
jgi:hypothetical protein